MSDSGPQKADGGGMRFNAGKNQIELIPPEWIWALGMVLTRGAIKYDTRNWERGMKWSYCVGCTARHLFKFICGERYDEETGCHHLALAAWNCLALMTYDIRKIGENDLVGKLEWLAAVAIEPGPALFKMMQDKLAPASPLSDKAIDKAFEKAPQCVVDPETQSAVVKKEPDPPSPAVYKKEPPVCAPIRKPRPDYYPDLREPSKRAETKGPTGE